MKILGKHIQSFDLIRTLAITCHALDLSFENLFIYGTYDNTKVATKKTFDRLLSTSLLHLAVAIRTNFYQGVLEGDSKKWVIHCGILDVKTKKGAEIRSFSIKDVCDKIIHAEKIHREPQESAEHSRTGTILRGTQGKEKWELTISIELFCGVVLNWLDEIS